VKTQTMQIPESLTTVQLPEHGTFVANTAELCYSLRWLDSELAEAVAELYEGEGNFSAAYWVRYPKTVLRVIVASELSEVPFSSAP